MSRLSFGVQRLFIARARVDMRKSFDTLAGLVRGQLGQDPLSGAVFVFVGKTRNRLKVLFWDGDGFWLCAKRRSRGTFALPFPLLAPDSPEVINVSVAQWASLLEGLVVVTRGNRPL